MRIVAQIFLCRNGKIDRQKLLFFGHIYHFEDQFFSRKSSASASVGLKNKSAGLIKIKNGFMSSNFCKNTSQTEDQCHAHFGEQQDSNLGAFVVTEGDKGNEENQIPPASDVTGERWKEQGEGGRAPVEGRWALYKGGPRWDPCQSLPKTRPRVMLPGDDA